MKEEKFKFELMKSFHEQFAQNQNHHQNLFIQVVSILLTVIIGFGYTLFNFKATGESNNNSTIGLFEFTCAFAISEIILSLGIALVSNMALGYRRDQLMNTRIREAAKITVDSETDKENKNEVEKVNYKIFASSYNPMKNYFNKVYNENKSMRIDWMPNFHIIFSITIITIQFLVVLIYFTKLAIANFLKYSENSIFDYSSLISIVGIVSCCFSFWLIHHFHNTLRKFYLNNGMQDLINNRYSNG